MPKDMSERDASRFIELEKQKLDEIPVKKRLPQDYFNYAKALEYIGWDDVARIYRKFGHERKAQLMLVHSRRSRIHK
jgi:hypothetical protein